MNSQEYQDYDNDSVKNAEDIMKDGNESINKKLKVLKKAYIELREEKKQLEQAFTQQQSQLIQLTHERDEKVEEIQKLSDLINSIQKNGNDSNTSYNSVSRRLQSANQNMDSSQINQSRHNDSSMFFDVFNRSSQRTLIRDSSRRDIDSLGMKVKLLNEENDKVKRDLRKQLEAVEAKSRSLGAQLDTRIHQYKELSEQFKIACEDNTYLKEQIYHMESQIGESEQQKEEREQMQMTLIIKEQQINQGNLLLQQQQESIDKAYSDGYKLEQQIKYILENIAQFRVTKLGMIQIECNLLLRKNILDQDVIELESATDRQTFLAYEISDLIPDKEKTDQFSIVIKTQKYTRSEKFKSIEAKQICKSLKHFLQRATEGRQSEIISSTSSSKGVLSGFACFFGK